MSVNTHEKPMMTLTIAKKKQVTVTKNEEALVTINSVDDIGRVTGTIPYRGIIVGRDTLRNELRLKVPETIPVSQSRVCGLHITKLNRLPFFDCFLYQKTNLSTFVKNGPLIGIS